MVDLRKIVSSTIVYGAADSLVVLIGGLLLLPLYTSTLSKQEFGSYIAVKTNTELLTYILHFGLTAAISRLYFDYRAAGEGRAYLVSLALWFPLQAIGFGLFIALAGKWVWQALTPDVAAWPYLAFALAIGSANFYYLLATVALRAEQRVKLFVTVQLIVAGVLVASAFLLLAVARFGLPGLMMALLVSPLCGCVVLPWVVRGAGALRIDFDHVRRSLRYAWPIVLGLLAYFVLNRVNILILQQYVNVRDLALYGLAQQLSLVIAIGSAAAAKALQPALFATPAAELPGLLRLTMRLFVAGMSCLASLVCLFATDILRIAAPRSYAGSLDILLILVTGAFAYSLTIASDTAVLCHRRPGASAVITILGAGLSVVLALVLIPTWGLIGAAVALFAASLAVTLVADRLAFRLTGFTNLAAIVPGLLAVTASAVAARCVHGAGMSLGTDLALRAVLAIIVIASHGLVARTIFRQGL